jgi:hypothetical protein
MELIPKPEGRVDLKISITGSKVIRTRYNVWELVNISFTPDFKIDVGEGESYKPHIILAASVKAPFSHFESQIARSAAYRSNLIKKRTGLAPCHQKLTPSKRPVGHRKN